MKTVCLPAFLSLIGLLGCNQLSEYSTVGAVFPAGREDEVILCAPGSKNDTTNANSENSHLKRTSSDSQLHVIAEGFKVVPLVGLNGLASFLPNRDSAVVYGDMILNESDLAQVHTNLAAQGLTIKDAHRYGARNGSIILFLHVNGFGNNAALTKRVSSLFPNFNPVTGEIFKESRLDKKAAPLNRAKLDSIIGYTGEGSGNVYRHAFRRPDVLRSHGMPVGTNLELNTWASWQGTDDHAVVAGDFMILENEVAAVIKALAENGFELVDNHPVHEGLAVFSLHYLGFGNAEKLAKGLKAALDQQQMR